MRIRPEAPADAAVIRALTAEAFKEAPFSEGAEAGIVDALRAAGALTLSLVAEEDQDIVGHVAFSPVRIAEASGDWYGLGPVSVRPDRQGRGIGQALIRAGLERLESLGAAGCVLVGAPAYYRRFGFESDPALEYPGDHAPYLQRLILAGPPPRGVVAFHPAFEA